MLKTLLQKRYYIPFVCVTLFVALILGMILPYRLAIGGQGILSIAVFGGSGAEVQIPETPNVVVFVKGDNFTPSDLTTKDWVNETKVGYKLTAEPLPPNVVVLGTPLMEGESVTNLDLTKGGVSYYRDGVEIFHCLPRITVDGKSTDLIVSSKTLESSSDLSKKSAGYSGTLADGTQVSVSIWASPIRDDTGEKISFTPIVDLPAFTYDYVFTCGKDITSIRYYESLGFHMGVIPHEISLDKDGEGELGNATGIRFISDKDIGGYTFQDVADKANRVTWVVKDGQFIVLFHFAGLKAGETFYNDGYFGSGEGTSNQNDATGYLSGSHFTNSIGDGNVTKLGLKFDDASPTGTCRIGLYADTSSAPGALLGGGVNTVTVANGWVEDTGLNIAVTDGTHYWIGYSMSADNTLKVESTTNYWKSFAYANLPNPFGAAALDSSYGYCMRAYVVLAVVDPSITNTPSSKNYGAVQTSTTYWAKGSDPSLITPTSDTKVPTTDSTSNNTWACSQIRLPTGDGDSSGTWTASTGTRTECINEADWDGTAGNTADYVTSPTVAGSYYLSTFTAFSIPSTANVTSLTLWQYIRENTAGTNDWDEVLKVGSTRYTTESNRNPGTTSTWYSVVYATNPSTSAAWTYDEINGNSANASRNLAQFGGEGDDLNPAFRINAQYLEVKYTVTAGTNYTVLDETSADYKDALVGTTDGGGFFLFTTATPSIPTGATVDNLTIVLTACDWDVHTADTNDIRAAVSVNGTNYLTTASTNNPGVVPATYSYAFTTNPLTTVAWTPGDINGTSSAPLQKIGCNSTDLIPDVGVSSLYAVVYYSKPLTDAQSTFAVTNNGTVAVNISFSSTNFTGASGWILGTPDATHARLTVYISGATSGTILTNAQQQLISALATSGVKYWELKLETPTAFADGTEKEAIITLTAVAS